MTYRLATITRQSKFLLIGLLAIIPVAQLGAAPPRLILQITVDQLRGDLPGRYYDRLGEGGFRYLIQNGTWYANAHHAHANTETIVGHVTLATGAYPAAHGMVANVWFDREAGTTTYNIEDARYTLLTAGADVDESTEIDPTQRAARSEGRSPAAILVSTFSDELAIHTADRARIFGVSVKDRGAVSLAGHAGKAFWFSKATGEFVTSTFYYRQYPQWVADWNARRLADAYANKSWELLHPRKTYLFGDADDRSWETDLAGFGRTFPHPYGKRDGKYYTTLLTVSPAGDELTLDFAKTLIEHEQLGRDEVPDYLAISFSSTDYVGHLFSPSSLEGEDNILRLDRVLKDLFAFVDQHIGLKNTLIVLAADHGAPEAPGYLNQLGIEAAYVDPEKWDQESAIESLKKKFGLGQDLIDAYVHPYVYLNRDLIAEASVNPSDVARAVALELEKFPGVAAAIASVDLREGRVADTRLNRAVLRNFHPKRSGDIYVVFEPHHFINDFDGLTVASTHGSPWAYDTHVPIFFSGPGVPSAKIHRRVDTVDVAATLSALLGTRFPSGSVGTTLSEVMDNQAP
jgi:predicted AlkP superfamily pyrophosphatase or phosphodiesterase